MGLSGRQLLAYVGDKTDIVCLPGHLDTVSLIPCTLPFANQAEISTIEDATFIAVKSRFGDSVLVRINED